MCGIAGIVGPRDGALDRVRDMIAVQRHRGPDDTDARSYGTVHLGHARLSILDLSAAGRQPMEVDDGRLSIVYNGEVFNYVELRRELEAAGYAFRTGTDTEVILRAYERWGTKATRRFNGMWAFALWDADKRRLWCSRDRFGVKPLHWAVAGEEFVFASEVKGLLAAVPSLARANESYLARFLSTNVCGDDDRTFFAQVRQLAPAHELVLDIGSDGRAGRPAVSQWWEPDVEGAAAEYDPARAPERLRELLDDAVRIRLRSDVPVGSCLSGGLDSSSIVALASARLDEPVRTFSALFDEPGFDESAFVRMVNSAFRTQPHEVRPGAEDFWDVFPRVCWHQDEPSAGPGVFSQWQVMSTAAGHVKVLLDGQGPDELLGGYTSFYADYMRSLLVWGLHPGNTREAARLSSAVWRRLGPRTLGYLASSWVPARMRDALLDRLRGTGGRGGMCAEFAALAPDEADPWRADPGAADRLGGVLRTATLRTSLPSLLRYEDRNSMAFSIEARTPFLDYRLVEFGLGLPFRQRIEGEWTKMVLRRAMEDALPAEVTWRRDKMGYATPLGAWMRTRYSEPVAEMLRSPEFRGRGVFDGVLADRVWTAHRAGRRDHAWRLWRMLSVEMWYRIFIDRTQAV